MTKPRDESPLPFDDERSQARKFVSLPASMRELRAEPALVSVTDFSSKGCRISGSNLPAGAEVWVEIDGYNPLRATVVWQKRGELGCEFYAAPTKVVAQATARSPRPQYVSSGPHPLRARLRERSADE